MRLSLLCLGAATALAACGPARASREVDSVPTLEVRNPNHIVVYEGRIPRCPFREVGDVSGQSYREVQAAAYRLRANAVVLEPQNETRANILEGTAVQFTSAACQN